MAKKPDIIVTLDGKNYVATCGQCSHKVTKGDKGAAIRLVWGHLVGRHNYPLTPHFDGVVEDHT